MGIMCALALCLSLPSLAGVGDSIILEARDSLGNLNTAFYSESGTFANSSGKSTAPGLTGIGCRYGSTYSSVAGLKEATFTVDIPEAGAWEVFGTWRSTTANKNPILYKIAHKDGVMELDVDQSQDMNLWHSLGTYNFNAGAGAGAVTISNAHINVSGNMWVDAVKFTMIAPVPEPGSILALCTGLIGLIGIRRRAA